MTVWHATCTMCTAHTVIRADKPAPTTCASCLAPIATLSQQDITITIGPR